MRFLKLGFIFCIGGFLTINSSEKLQKLLPVDIESQPVKITSVKEKFGELTKLSEITGCCEEKRDHWLLSLDGGGIRGFNHLRALANLESLTRKSIVDLFDGFTGASAGGIIASLLALRDPLNLKRPKYSPKNLLDILNKRKSEVFVSGCCSCFGIFAPHYKSESIENLLVDLLGKSTFKDFLLPVVIPATKLGSYSVELFSTNDKDNYLIKDVVMATLSEPTYFKPYSVRAIGGTIANFYTGGGVTMDNPVIAGIALLHSHYGVPSSKVNILSFGTGQSSDDTVNNAVLKGGDLSWISEIGKMLVNTQLSTTENTTRFYCGDRYHRFDLY